MNGSACPYIYIYAPFFLFNNKPTLTITTMTMRMKSTIAAATIPAITPVDNPAEVIIKYETLNTHLNLSLLHSYVVDLIKCAEAAVSA